jgi:NAD+ kinase
MKRILTFGRELSTINTLITDSGLSLVDTDPEVIVTHGGDGTLLEAERLYPGIPKLPIRHSSVCKNCVDHVASHLISLLAQDKLSSSQLAKLEADIDGKQLHALNEFSLYHKVPNQAIRFILQINDEQPVTHIIGDGVIVATPFGSHAYYRSITNSTFRMGIGIAYNNTTEPIDHTVVRETDTVTIELTRGTAYVLCDNDPELLTIEAGARFTIRHAAQPAIMLGLDHVRCPDCGEIESHIAA